jgi:DNA modification methylase
MAAKGNSAPTYKSGSGAEIADKLPAIKGSNGAPVAIEMLPIDELIPYAKNPKSHPPSQIAKLASGIREFGFIIPNVIDKDNIIVVGHGRTLAAKEAGLRILPCIRAEHLTPAQIKAFRLFENRSGEDSSWLDDLLREELLDLKGLDFDLALTGFDERQLDKLLLDDAELARAEETPPVPENPVTVKGDVWILGKHRIVCGDSTVATDVEKALNGVKPHLMVTDPPYGVDYDPDWRNKAVRSDGTPIGASAIGTVKNDDKADWTAAWTLFPGEVAYIWHADRHASEVQRSIEAAGFAIRCQIIWAKNNIAIGRGDYHWQHEPCWYAVKSKGKGHWSGDRSQSTLWKIDKPQKSETGHSTQKPVECMLKPIKNNSSPGQAVYEPFSGSGTTIIAGEMSERSVHAIELNEAYVDVAVLRWQEFASGKATLEGDGRTFDEIKAERHGGQDKAKARSKAEA